jgi:hypothetical protein
MFNANKYLILLLLPLLLTSCARAEGALAPTGVAPESSGYAPKDNGEIEFLPQTQPESLEPIINYVDGLNLALTGEFLYLRSTALPDCNCLAIANRLEKFLKTGSLIGGNYQLKSIKLEKDGLTQKSFKVVVARSDLRKLDKFNNQSTIWSASKITNTFTVKKIERLWLLSDIQ